MLEDEEEELPWWQGRQVWPAMLLGEDGKRVRPPHWLVVRWGCAYAEAANGCEAGAHEKAQGRALRGCGRVSPCLL